MSRPVRFDLIQCYCVQAVRVIRTAEMGIGTRQCVMNVNVGLPHAHAKLVVQDIMVSTTVRYVTEMHDVGLASTVMDCVTVEVLQ